MTNKKGVVAGSNKTAALFINMDTKSMQEVALLATKYPTDYRKQWDTKWDIFARVDKAWHSLPRSVQVAVVGAKVLEVSTSKGINDTVARNRDYNRQIEKGVYVRDLIQPLDEKGNPNPDFVERYGIANYDEKQKEHIRDTMGRDPNREKDWRSAKK